MVQTKCYIIPILCKTGQFMIKKLYVTVETKSRDLDSRLLISVKTLSAADCPSIDIVIGRRDKVITEMSKESGGGYAYLAKSFEEGLARRIVSQGGLFIFMDEEGLVQTKHYNSNTPHRRYDSEFFNDLGQVFCVGKYARDKMLLRHPRSANKVAITGNPRFDLSKPKYKGYYNSFSHEAREYEPYILVNTVFCQSNNIVDYSLDRWNHARRSPDRTLTDVDRIFLARRKFQQKMMPLFVKGIKAVAESYREVSIVVRPHPAENMNYYKEQFHEYQNIHVIRNGAIQEWLHDARIVIHNGCTTAIEGIFASVTPVCFVPYLEEDHIQSLPLQLSIRVETEKDLIEIVRDYVTGEPKRTKLSNYSRLELLRGHIDNVDHDATETIVNHIIDLINNWGGACADKKLKIESMSNKKVPIVTRLLKYIYSKIMLLTGEVAKLKEVEKERATSKFPGLSLDEIMLRIRALNKIDKDLGDILVRSLSKDIFVLRRR